MNLGYEKGPEDIKKFPFSGVNPNTGVQEDINGFKAEPRDILSKDEDGNFIRVCTTEMGLDTKGDLGELFSDNIPDFKNAEEAKAYVNEMMKKLKREGRI